MDESSLSTTFSKAKKALLLTQQAVERLETTESSAHIPSELEAISQDVGHKLRELQSVNANLSGLWHQVVQQNRLGTSKQTIWKQKVELNEQEFFNLKHCYDSFLSRQSNREAQKRERAELLLRRTGGSGGGQTHQNNSQYTEAQMRRSMANSNQVLEDIFGQGSAIISGLQGQRDRLKRAQRKMLDVLNTLGISEQLLRAAERRMKMDKWIVYGGMIIITLVMYFTWRLIH